MQELIRSLPERAGRGSVEGVLEDVARAALAARLEALPVRPVAAGSAGGDAAWREARAALAAYLRLEQRLGRVGAGCDPEPVARLLLGACERRALHLQVLGDAALGSAGGFASELAHALSRTLVPTPR